MVLKRWWFKVRLWACSVFDHYEPPIAPASKSPWVWVYLWAEGLWCGLWLWITPMDWRPTKCYWCGGWFSHDFFWNPWGPGSGPGLCCSMECCNNVHVSIGKPPLTEDDFIRSSKKAQKCSKKAQKSG